MLTLGLKSREELSIALNSLDLDRPIMTSQTHCSRTARKDFTLPLFPLIDPNIIEGIHEASKSFVSLVDFISEFICQHRRRIEDSDDSSDFSKLLGTVIECSPFMDQMTQFVLSSSFSLAFTDIIVFFETEDLTVDLLLFLKEYTRMRTNTPAVQKRHKQIVVRLTEEGLLDEIELHFRADIDDYRGRRRVFVGALLIDQMGGNAHFVVEGLH